MLYDYGETLETSHLRLSSTKITRDEIDFIKHRLIILTQQNHFPNEHKILKLKQKISATRSLLTLNPFMDRHGIIRANRRLAQSPVLTYNDRYPILLLYKALIPPVFLYGAEAWTLLSTDAAALRVVGSKVLRKIFGPMRFGDDFRIRHNSELYELLNDLDIVQHINIQRLRWLSHVVHMEEDAPARRVFDAGIYGSRRRGRFCIR